MAIARVQGVEEYSDVSLTQATVTISGASAGDLLVSAINFNKSSGAITVPSGWTLVHDYVSSEVSGALAYKVATGGETSVVWNWTSSQAHQAWVGEFSGFTTPVLDQSAEDDSGASSVGVMSTGTTGETTAAEELAVAAAGWDSVNAGSSPVAWTNSFTADGDINRVNNALLATAYKILSSTQTVETTADLNDANTDQAWAAVGTFKSSPTGWAHKISGVSSPGKVSGVDADNIKSISGVE